MTTETHLFYVYSNSHALICYQIIEDKKLNKNLVKFLTFKGVKIIKDFEENVVKLHVSNSSFLKKYKEINNDELKFLQNQIIAYVPYRWAKNIFFYKKVNYFEEGIDVLQKETISYPIYHIFRDIILGLVFLFLSELLLINKNRNLKSFLRGEIHFRKITDLNFRNKSNYFGLFTKPNLNNAKNIKIKLLAINLNLKIRTNLKRDSKILILDPILSNLGFNVFKDFIEYFLNEINFESYYVQFHPTDKLNIHNIQKALNFLMRYKNFKILDENIDFVCTKNMNLQIYGVASSLLIYAKILGKNKSYSFYPYVYKNIEEYKLFLKFRGSYNNFCKLLTNSGVSLIS